MTKSVISIFLGSLFVLFLTAPTVILVVDKNADVSIFYNNAAPEEEEKQGVSKDTEVLYYKTTHPNAFNEAWNAENNLEYFFKNSKFSGWL